MINRSKKMNLDSPVKSQPSDDKRKRFRCKAHKHEGMRRTYWYAGLAEFSQAMSEDAVQRSRWSLAELPGRHECHRAGSQAFYEVVKLFAKNLCNASLILIVLLLFPAHLRGAPTLSLSLDDQHITAQKTFTATLTLSWKGEADQYLIEPPQLTLPEDINETGTASRSITREDHYLLEYRFDLRAEKEGDYVIEPVEISYWEKGNKTVQIVKTEALPFSVTTFTFTSYGNYWLIGLLAIIFLSLFTVLIVLSKKKKRHRSDHRIETPSLKEMITRELKECHSYKITGDWENYLKKAIAIRDKLPTEDKGGKAMETLDNLAERVHYGGLHPTTEEINHIQRQLEHALKNAFPKEKDKEMETIAFRE
jgi:hypothetical protein